MKMEKKLSQNELKQLLHYDPESGIFTWLMSNKKNAYSGKTAGTISISGYLVINIGNVQYFLHRLAILYVHGVGGSDQVDHINHVKTDNRIVNLRQVTRSENQRNLSLSKRNTTGEVGVYLDKKKLRYYSQIYACGKTIHLGYFSEKADAIKARKEANIKYSFHENHGAKPCF